MKKRGTLRNRVKDREVDDDRQMTWIDYKCQEKKEEADSSALRVALMQPFKDLRKSTAASKSDGNIKTNRKTIKIENKSGKNNCMDTRIIK